MMRKSFQLKPDYPSVAARFADFWQHKEMDKPLLYAKVAKKHPLVKAKEFPGLSRRQKDDNPDWHLNYIQQQLWNYDYLWESVPNAQVMLGRDIVALACLAGYDFEMHEQTEFIRFTSVPDLLERPKPQFRADLPFVQKAMQIYINICQAVGDLAFVNPPTSADALTTVALLLGENNFCKACLRQPEQVLDTALAFNALFYDFYDYIYRFLTEQGYGQSGSWFPVLAEGKFDGVRSDISVMLSPAVFQTLSLPLLEAACARLDYSMFNLDSTDLFRFLPLLSKCSGLQGIYWNIEAWRRDFNEQLPLLKQLKDAGMLLAIPCHDAQEMALLTQKLGADGLLFEFIGPTDAGHLAAISKALDNKNAF